METTEPKGLHVGYKMELASMFACSISQRSGRVGCVVFNGIECLLGHAASSGLGDVTMEILKLFLYENYN